MLNFLIGVAVADGLLLALWLGTSIGKMLWG